MAGTAARALEFKILTAMRTGEVIGALPEEFDMLAQLWTVPAAGVKAKRAHRAPLSSSALGATLCAADLGKCADVRRGEGASSDI